jgi:hypothetical protein
MQAFFQDLYLFRGLIIKKINEWCLLYTNNSIPAKKIVVIFFQFFLKYFLDYWILALQESILAFLGNKKPPCLCGTVFFNLNTNYYSAKIFISYCAG